MSQFCFFSFRTTFLILLSKYESSCALSYFHLHINHSKISNKSLRILRSCIVLTKWHIGPYLYPDGHGYLILRPSDLRLGGWHNGRVFRESWLRVNCPFLYICKNIKKYANVVKANQIRLKNPGLHNILYTV